MKRLLKECIKLLKKELPYSKKKGVGICGKTGTVENFIRINNEKTQLTDHSIFIGFAPKEDPKMRLLFLLKMDIGELDGLLNR